MFVVYAYRLMSPLTKINLYQRLFTIDTEKPVLQRLCKWLGKIPDGNFRSVVWP